MLDVPVVDPSQSVGMFSMAMVSEMLTSCVKYIKELETSQRSEIMLNRAVLPFVIGFFF